MVKWSLDNKYILSGSMEMNIRVWKARAAEKLGVVSLCIPAGYVSMAVEIISCSF